MVMSMGREDFDYKFGNKNNWRRWAWNRVMERLQVPNEDATVLYLAGRDNLDGEICLSHGFRQENMLAVEAESESLSELRQNGVLAIDGDLFDVCRSWRSDGNVHVVWADLCGGLSRRVLDECMKISLLRHLGDTVFMFNMLRGRDASSNEVRHDRNKRALKGVNDARDSRLSAIQSMLGCSEEEALKRWTETLENIWAEREKHRGYHLWDNLVAWNIRLITDQIVITESGNLCRQPGFVESGEKSFEEVQAWNIRKTLEEIAIPVFRSYVSTSGQTFDSVIFRNPFGAICHNATASQKFSSACDRFHATLRDKTISRRIAAVLAHRTRRMQAV